jgi:thiol-disulfide isomerase/thioredoxin
VKKVLIICFTDLKSDPRPNRQIRFLKNNYLVTAMGLKSPDIENVDFVSVNRRKTPYIEKFIKFLLLIGKAFETFYWRQLKIYQYEFPEDRKFDLIIANDIDTLPLALKLAYGAKVLFDAHEYSPKEFEDDFGWELLYGGYKHYLCKKYIPKCDAMVTVCDGLAAEYYRNYGKKPHVITNATDFIDLSPQPVSYENVKLVHHGIAVRTRKIEKMIEVMDYVDARFHFFLILVPKDPEYYKKLEILAKKNSRIHFLPPVEMKNISEYINQFDVGIYLLEPNSFNNRFALPNKIFEFVQARLAIAIGPSPEMADIVKKYDLGVAADDFSSQALANSLQTLTINKLNYYKGQAHRHAREMSSEGNAKALKGIVSQLIGI